MGATHEQPFELDMDPTDEDYDAAVGPIKQEAPYWIPTDTQGWPTVERLDY